MMLRSRGSIVPSSFPISRYRRHPPLSLLFKSFSSSPSSPSPPPPPPPHLSSSSSSSRSSSATAASGGLAAVLPLLCPSSSSSSSSSSKLEFIPTLLQPRVVVYDGFCRRCHNGVKWVINADRYKKIKFCCLQSKTADPYLRFAGLDREDVQRQFLFVEGPYSYYQGSTAALRVASYLPLPFQAISLLLIIPPPLRDMVYQYNVRKYHDQSKEEDFIVLEDKDMINRFIDRDEILAKAKDIKTGQL